MLLWPLLSALVAAFWQPLPVRAVLDTVALLALALTWVASELGLLGFGGYQPSPSLYSVPVLAL